MPVGGNFYNDAVEAIRVICQFQNERLKNFFQYEDDPFQICCQYFKEEFVKISEKVCTEETVTYLSKTVYPSTAVEMRPTDDYINADWNIKFIDGMVKSRVFEDEPMMVGMLVKLRKVLHPESKRS